MKFKGERLREGWFFSKCRAGLLYIFTCSRLHILTYSHLLIVTSSETHTFTSSYRCILTSAHLHTHTHTFTHLLSSTSSHLRIFTDLHTSSHSQNLLSLVSLALCHGLSPSFSFLRSLAVPTRPRDIWPPFRTKQGSKVSTYKGVFVQEQLLVKFSIEKSVR